MVLSALAWQLSWLLEKRAYKLQYSAEIKRYSREFDIDPYLVAAIIHCESSNRHTVVSRAGAKVKKWLNDEKYSKGGELDSIPFKETAQYVERVQRAYDKYTKLYANELG